MPVQAPSPRLPAQARVNQESATRRVRAHPEQGLALPDQPRVRRWVLRTMFALDDGAA
jgi:hypothetical protein